MSIMTRTREEILKKIEEIEAKKFWLDMQDRWEPEDYLTMNKYRAEIRKLEKELEAA